MNPHKGNIRKKTNKSPKHNPLPPQQTTRNSGAGLHIIMEGGSAGSGWAAAREGRTHTKSRREKYQKELQDNDQASERRQTD